MQSSGPAERRRIRAIVQGQIYAGYGAGWIDYDGEDMSRTFITVVAVVSVLVAGGCASRPTGEDLTNSIIRAADADPSINLTNEEATCISERLLDAELSDTTLEGLAENFDQPKVLAAEQDRIEPLVTEAAIICAG